MIASRLRTAARLFALMAVAAAVLVFVEPARAVTVPETMADQKPVGAGPVVPGFPIDHVGVLWDDPTAEHASEEGDPEPHGAVRFRHGGQWGPWTPLIEDGASGDGLWASGLVAGDDAEAYQVRGLPGDARSARAVAINTTDGPEVEIGETRGGAAGALDSTQCRSRKDWGADESLRFTGGNETWSPDFHPVQALTVHHTATTNDDPDPEATVRAIYRYHAVDKGWGDIGYQYLVDEAGVVYEGRWSGTESASCRSGVGDGSDFGHETTDLDGDGTTDEMVTAAHVGGWNSGNMGVALLGDFTKRGKTGGQPTSAAVGSLEDVLTELSVRHDLDPTGTVPYVNPVNGASKTVDTISGHRDWQATECPGDRLYEQLPTIRQRVKDNMAGGGTDDGGTDDGDSTTPPTVSVSGTDRGRSNPLVVAVGQTLNVDGSGFVEGATVVFEKGKGHTPTITDVRLVSSSQLEVMVTVEPKGPSSLWDLRVTLPDGRTGSCSACVYVSR